MSDIKQAVAEAIYTHEHNDYDVLTWDDPDLPSEVRGLYLDRARAAINALVAQGDVSDKQIAAMLEAEGISRVPQVGNDGDIHSWRCVYPERYGPCSCFDEMVAEVRALLAQAQAVSLARAEAAESERDDAHDVLLVVARERDALDGENRGLREYIDTLMDGHVATLVREAEGRRDAEWNPIVGRAFIERDAAIARAEAERDALRATVERVQALCDDADARPRSVIFGGGTVPHSLDCDRVRAALADPKEKGA